MSSRSCRHQRSSWICGLAQHVLDVLYIAPAIGIAILQPDECSADVWWTMLGVVNDDRLFAPSRHENFDSLIVMSCRPGK
jgi:hypothetical protein